MTKPTAAVPWLGGDWYLWHAPDGLRAIAATALGCMQACAEKLGVLEASFASAIIGGFCLKSMISSRGGIRGRESFSLPKTTAALYPAWETWMAPNVRPMSVGN